MQSKTSSTVCERDHRPGLSLPPPVSVEEACQLHERAVALREQGQHAEAAMRPLQAHCHRGLGTLYAKLGQREQASAALSIAIELYRAMEMTFWLPAAEAALAQVA